MDLFQLEIFYDSMILPQRVSILPHMTGSFHPVYQHILLSVEHTRYTLGSFPTEWLVQARCYWSLVANRTLQSKVIGYKRCSEWSPLLRWASNQAPCCCNTQMNNYIRKRLKFHIWKYDFQRWNKAPGGINIALIAHKQWEVLNELLPAQERDPGVTAAFQNRNT